MAVRKKNSIMKALMWAAPIAVGTIAQELVEGFRDSQESEPVKKVQASLMSVNIWIIAGITGVAALVAFVTGLHNKR